MARFNYITKKDALDIRDLKNYEIQEWIPYVAREKTAALVKMITKIKCGPLHTLECGEVHGSPHTFLVRDSRHTTYAIARVSMDETRYRVCSYAIQKQKKGAEYKWHYDQDASIADSYIFGILYLNTLEGLYHECRQRSN